MGQWQTIFSKEMIKQFQKLATNKELKEMISSMLDELEAKGPQVGELLDSRLHLYELKRGNPSVRIYFKPKPESKKIDIFEYEIKKGKKKQNKTINKLRKKMSKS